MSDLIFQADVVQKIDANFNKINQPERTPVVQLNKYAVQPVYEWEYSEHETFNSVEEAIEFAKSNNWQEAVIVFSAAHLISKTKEYEVIQ